MCRDRCRCNPGPQNANKNLWQNADVVVNFNRNELRWASKDGEGVNNFLECMDRKKDQMSRNNDAKRFFEDGGMDLLVGLEEKFDCSGYCEVGRFYLAKDISYGPPQTDCIRGMIKGLSGSVGTAGYVTIITGLVLIIGMIGAFPLCTGFSKPEDNA